MDFLEENAEKAEERGDLTSALRLWNQLAKRERDPVFFTRYGRVAERLEKWDDAESAFAEALRVDPSFALAMEAMGDLWAKRTDKSEDESFEIAKDWFLKALRFERNARTLILLGATYRALGEDLSARHTFAEALQLDPNNAEVLYGLATSEADEDRRKAIEHLERAIEISPNYFIAHQQLGKLHHRDGDLLGAECDFRRSLEIEPGDLWSLLYLANTLAVQGRISEAEETYRLAMTLHPDNKDGAEFFAQFLDSIGKNGEAASMRSARSS
jgi:tetratricopeptide (TPR) repeat protein